MLDWLHILAQLIRSLRLRLLAVIVVGGDRRRTLQEEIRAQNQCRRVPRAPRGLFSRRARPRRLSHFFDRRL
jgi:hypothetical protein